MDLWGNGMRRTTFEPFSKEFVNQWDNFIRRSNMSHLNIGVSRFVLNGIKDKSTVDKIAEQLNDLGYVSEGFMHWRGVCDEKLALQAIRSNVNSGINDIMLSNGVIMLMHGLTSAEYVDLYRRHDLSMLRLPDEVKDSMVSDTSSELERTVVFKDGSKVIYYTPFFDGRWYFYGIE